MALLGNGGSDQSSARLIILACLYFASSCFMLLANKLTINFFPAPATVGLIQYIVTCVAVLLLSYFNIIENVQRIEMETVKKYWVVPALFATAIFANGKLLEYSNVETFIVCRNTTPLIVSLNEFLFMGKSLPTLKNMICFIAIIIGAIIYMVTDEGFSLRSYAWALIYLFVICIEMILVKHVFTVVDMSNWSRVYYNNALSIPFQPLFALMTNEYEKILDIDWTNPNGIVFLALSSLVGLSLAYSGTAFRHMVSATTFTVVGVANKIIVVAVNYVMWDQHANLYGIISLMICLIGAALYTPAPHRSPGDFSTTVFESTNTCCCGYIKKLELEQADQHHHQQQQSQQSTKYQPVSTEENDHDQSQNNDIELSIKGSASDVQHKS